MDALAGANGTQDDAAVIAAGDCIAAACLFAIDPAGLGGVALRARAGPGRDAWLRLLRALLPVSSALRRVPLHVNDGRLLGGLDLAATLQAGRPVAERGLLAEVDGGVAILAMAERLEPTTVARIASAMDAGEVRIERDGIGHVTATRFGVVALDEGIEDDERPPAALLERLAFLVSLDAVLGGIERRDVGAETVQRMDVAELDGLDASAIEAARARLASVTTPESVVPALCGAALALGIDSVRVPLLALRAARAAAALAGHDRIDDDDLALAARLVLAPRATRVPAAEPPPEAADDEQDETQEPPDDADREPRDAAEPPPPPPETSSDSPPPEELRDPTPDELQELVLAAVRSGLQAGLLERLRAGAAASPPRGGAGRSGERHRSGARGRPLGARRGERRSGARLHLLETLRAAAPWQRLRSAERAAAAPATLPAAQPSSGAAPTAAAPAIGTPRIDVRREDFRIARREQRSQTTTIFAVDASGSAALHRLAEAKGAVELLLADCYVRRDRVALIAFRGREATLLLPPTRSLVRAKRELAGLPGGGGTPLASGIDAVVALAEALRRAGDTPVTVLLTDGRANVARDGSQGRPQAEADALDAARRARLARIGALLVDTSPRPQPLAQGLATAMAATYLPMPYADAATLSRAVRAASAPAHG